MAAGRSGICTRKKSRCGTRPDKSRRPCSAYTPSSVYGAAASLRFHNWATNKAETATMRKTQAWDSFNRMRRRAYRSVKLKPMVAPLVVVTMAESNSTYGEARIPEG